MSTELGDEPSRWMVQNGRIDNEVDDYSSRLTI